MCRQKEFQERSFSGLQRRKGGLLPWVRESRENPFFVFVLLCFVCVCSAHSAGSPVTVVVAREMPNTLGAGGGPLFDQRNCGPKSEEHRGYSYCSFPFLLSTHLATEGQIVTGSLRQVDKLKPLLSSRRTQESGPPPQTGNCRQDYGKERGEESDPIKIYIKTSGLFLYRSDHKWCINGFEN